MDPVLLPEKRSRLRKILAAAGGPALITSALLIVPHVGVATAALAYVLAVAAGALLGGLASGVAAALLSFAALHYFFTPPPGFAMPLTADLVAVVTFLVVSVVLGATVSTTVAHRIGAERSAREANLMHQVSAGLLGDRGLEDVLSRFAHSAVELLGLSRCTIATAFVDVDVTGQSPSSGGGGSEEVTMSARGRRIGSIVATPADRRSWGEDERRMLRSFADQLALAIDDVGVSARATRAETEAATNKATAALFSSVTHDLRTPLASILASATSLRDLGPTFGVGDRSVLLDAICSEAERLNRLVGEILDMSKIRAGALHPQRAPASIEEVVVGVITRLGRSLDAHRVVLDLQPGLPDAPLDVVQVDQVVTNLVENAGKFSPPGTTIRISAASTDGRIRVEVADRGPGIDDADRERVFEPFETAPRAPSAGAGLGLAICRAVVEAHGGRIWIEDSVEPGTRVVFELPTASAP